MKLDYTLQAKEVLDIAAQIARENKHRYIGTEHLLYGLCVNKESTAGMILSENGADIAVIEDYIRGNNEEIKGRVKWQKNYSAKLLQILDNAEKEVLRQLRLR